MVYLSSTGDHQLLLDLYIQPKASRSRIIGLHDNAIKLAVSAPPVDGRANKEVIAFMAKLFKLPKSSMEIISGHQGRRKKLLISGGLSEKQARQILDPLL